jgi:hypothetical protein
MRSLSLGFSCVPLLVVLPTSPAYHAGLGKTGPSSPFRSAPDEIPEGLTAQDWESIRNAYEDGRHRVFPVEGGHRARNPRQQWSTFFDGRGFTTAPDDGDWIWGHDLTRYGWAQHLGDVGQPQGVTTDGGRVSYSWDGFLTEWYQNDTRGLEHGYTVHERPHGAAGSLVLELGIRGQLKPVVSKDGRDVRFVDTDGKELVTYAGLSVLDANGETLSACWRASCVGLQLSVDDREADYPLFIDPIAQQAHLTASNPGQEDWFGRSVSISGDTVVIGAHREDSNATGIDGDQTNNGASSAGAAYVFVRNGTTWGSQPVYLKASNTEEGDEFGISVAISGDTIVVGAHQEDSAATGVNGNQGNGAGGAGSGAAYVFFRSMGSWTQQAYLKASNAGGNGSDAFGTAVAVSGNTILIGAIGEDSSATGVNGLQGDDPLFLQSGAAYVFVRSGTSWSQQAYLKASNTEDDDVFGTSVSVFGDTAVVGAESEDSIAADSGAAYVFVRSGLDWSHQSHLKASNAAGGDGFGHSISAFGDNVVVGAPFEDDSNTTNSGAAYVFSRNGATWTERAYLKASNKADDDHFGVSVSISGNTALVGAELANGGVGAADTFAPTGTSWLEEAYLPAPAGGGFGVSVSVSDHTAVIGAFKEQGVASETGAAYVFDLAASVVYCTAGTSASGCQASVSSLGHASATATSGFELITTNLEGQKDGLYFFGTNGRQANSWGNGTSYQCVVPPVIRTPLVSGSGTVGLCDGQTTVDLNALWCPSCPFPQKNPGVGALVQAQLWYRDPLNTSNQTTSFSDAIEFPVTP